VPFFHSLNYTFESIILVRVKRTQQIDTRERAQSDFGLFLLGAGTALLLSSGLVA
jgi:hypothetical protein